MSLMRVTCVMINGSDAVWFNGGKKMKGEKKLMFEGFINYYSLLSNRGLLTYTRVSFAHCD